MKILLDLQGAQCQSRHRGIGRYTSGLAPAFARLASGRHDLLMAFNSRLDEATDTLIADLGDFADHRHRLVLPGLPDISAHVPGNALRRRLAERLTRYALDEHDADVVWLSSVFEGYVDDAVIPDSSLRRAATVATLFDLIPLHDPEAYLGHPQVKRWYEGRLKALRRCDLLLSISDWVRQDALDRLGLPADKVVTIGAGLTPQFLTPAVSFVRLADIAARHGIDRPFVLYSGGFDPRKNVERLIAAFAALPLDIVAGHQLVIVGHAAEDQLAAMRATARKARLAPGSLIFTGFVSDGDLTELYAGCALFVFPSLYEGFGLPPLEAMACGAPTIGSNTSSLPQVIGDAHALFDPTSVDAITRSMLEVLRHPTLAEALRENGRNRAQHFSWAATATRALQAIESLAGNRNAPLTGTAIRRRLLCLISVAEIPAWLSQLEWRYQTSIHRLDEGGRLPEGLEKELRAAERILYIVDGATVGNLFQSLRLWPGTIWLVSPLPRLDRDSSLANRYRHHGYEGLTQTTELDVETVLARACIGMVRARRDDEDISPESSHGMAFMPSHGIEARFCAEHMEACYARLPLGREQQVLDELAAISGTQLDQADIANLSAALVAARRRPLPQIQWLVDVSQIAANDIGTGVQRVVRSILREWLRQAPAHVRIEPVAFVDGRYRYARRYTFNLLGLPCASLEDDVVEAGPEDCFIGLDWAIESFAAAEPQLRAWRRRGMRLHFVVNDILPLTLPWAFHPHSKKVFGAWLAGVCQIADSVHCISRTTAGELTRWLESTALHYQFGRPPVVDHFLLGVDRHTDKAAPARIAPTLAQALDSRSTLLMVGTLEPRKGHAQALDAFEQLWREGLDANLLIVGHYGWLVENLATRMERHAERDRRLFWLTDADDRVLETLYGKATALLAPSWGEGYGLPLIEAAQHGLPVIARELPVFREIMGEYPYYFTADSAPALAHVLQTWLFTRPRPGAAQRWPDWKISAESLADTIRE